jgi:hypothetical protein
MSEVERKEAGATSGDSLRGLGTDALQRVPLAANLLGVGLGRRVRAGGVDAAIVRLVGIPKQMRGVGALQGRARRQQIGVQRRDSPAMCRLHARYRGTLTSESEGRRPSPRQDEQMPME